MKNLVIICAGSEPIDIELVAIMVDWPPVYVEYFDIIGQIELIILKNTTMSHVKNNIATGERIAKLLIVGQQYRLTNTMGLWSIGEFVGHKITRDAAGVTRQVEARFDVQLSADKSIELGEGYLVDHEDFEEIDVDLVDVAK